MVDAGARAVFFDAVGTLLFPAVPVARTYAEFARGHGLVVAEDEVAGRFREAFARQERIDARAGWRTDEDRERARWQAIVSDVLPGCGQCFDDLWEWFSTLPAWTVHPEAGDVLRRLADHGLTLGIASNFDSRLLRLVAAIPELAPVRDRCAISSLVGWRKPAGKFFDHLVGLASCEPAKIVLVGDDRRNDFDGAVAAGLRAILYDPHHTATDLPAIHQLRDLLSP